MKFEEYRLVTSYYYDEEDLWRSRCWKEIGQPTGFQLRLVVQFSCSTHRHGKDIISTGTSYCKSTPFGNDHMAE